MKGLIAKTVSLFLVVGILLCYQVNANSRAELISAHDNEQAQADELQKEYDKQVAEAKAAFEGAESAAAELKYKDGTYTGSATGFGGDIKVEIKVENDAITSLEVLDHSGEDEAYFNTASVVIDTILTNGSTDGVDTVSGATFSSTGIIGAVNAALEEAEN